MPNSEHIGTIFTMHVDENANQNSVGRSVTVPQKKKKSCGYSGLLTTIHLGRFEIRFLLLVTLLSSNFSSSLNLMKINGNNSCKMICVTQNIRVSQC